MLYNQATTNQYPNTSTSEQSLHAAQSNSYGNNGEANGMSSNQAQYDGITPKMTAAVAPNIHNNYSPNRVFSNGSNNSPNTNSFAGHSGKLKAAAAFAMSRPG
jgi:hypothetical protein